MGLLDRLIGQSEKQKQAEAEAKAQAWVTHFEQKETVFFDLSAGITNWANNNHRSPCTFAKLFLPENSNAITTTDSNQNNAITPFLKQHYLLGEQMPNKQQRDYLVAELYRTLVERQPGFFDLSPYNQDLVLKAAYNELGFVVKQLDKASKKTISYQANHEATLENHLLLVTSETAIETLRAQSKNKATDKQRKKALKKLLQRITQETAMPQEEAAQRARRNKETRKLKSSGQKHRDAARIKYRPEEQKPDKEASFWDDVKEGWQDFKAWFSETFPRVARFFNAMAKTITGAFSKKDKEQMNEAAGGPFDSTGDHGPFPRSGNPGEAGQTLRVFVRPDRPHNQGTNGQSGGAAPSEAANGLTEEQLEEKVRQAAKDRARLAAEKKAHRKGHRQSMREKYNLSQKGDNNTRNSSDRNSYPSATRGTAHFDHNAGRVAGAGAHQQNSRRPSSYLGAGNGRRFGGGR